MIKMLTILVLAAVMFAPAPVIQPGDPFVFDPNHCPSPAMLAVVIPVGVPYSGQLEVYEPDGELVTVVVSEDTGNGVPVSQITVDDIPVTVKDTDDPLGLAVIHTFTWDWTPTMADIGLHYINVNVVDPHGAADDRTIVLLVKVNQPPIITGCR